jgi:type VI secretion system protein ImpA
MSVIEIEPLLAEVSASAPCGDNLEYDPAYGELERAAAGKEEQQFGDTVVPAEAPNWREVRRRAIDLLKQSKDLRIGMYLTRALLHTAGFAGLCDGVLLLERLVERFWDQAHPQLDPDDDNDPTTRVNTLMTLCSATAVLGPLRETPLVALRSVGSFTLRDVQIAAGELAPVEEHGQPPDAAAIEAAFAECELDELRSTHNTIEETTRHVRALEQAVTEHVGAAQAPNFDDLVALLRAMQKLLHTQLDKRGALTVVEPTSQADGGTSDGPDGEMTGAHAAPPARLAGEIHSRDDVVRALDMVCKYYERHEPSSPLPLLLKRAKRLATMSFIEIIRELTPDGVGQAEAIAGLLGERRESEE